MGNFLKLKKKYPMKENSSTESENKIYPPLPAHQSYPQQPPVYQPSPVVEQPSKYSIWDSQLS